MERPAKCPLYVYDIVTRCWEAVSRCIIFLFPTVLTVQYSDAFVCNCGIERLARLLATLLTASVHLACFFARKPVGM